LESTKSGDATMSVFTVDSHQFGQVLPSFLVLMCAFVDEFFHECDRAIFARGFFDLG
jgi:hypothetical protein